MDNYIPTSNQDFENSAPINWEEAEKGITTPYRISTINEFMKKDLPPRRLLLAPWLPQQGIAMVYATRGLGKTYFALEVALAVATGGEFLGWKASKAKRVLYIDGEMCASDLQKRCKDICKRRGVVLDQNFKIMTPDEQAGAMPDLSDPSSQSLLKTFTDVDLIVVDNISTLCRSGNENEAESWLTTQEWALRLKAEGKTVLFIHHAGKGGAQRGTSKREDTMDTVISLKHPKDYKPSEGARFEVHFEKSRGFSGDDAEPLEAKLRIDEDKGQEWDYQRLEDSLTSKIIALDKDGLTQVEIAKELEINKSTVCRRLANARAEGKL